MNLTIVSEWLRCLISPSYAQTSWLRITPEAESKLYRNCCLALAVLLIACAASLNFARLRYNQRQYILRHSIEIMVLPGERVI